MGSSHFQHPLRPGGVELTLHITHLLYPRGAHSQSARNLRESFLPLKYSLEGIKKMSLTQERDPIAQRWVQIVRRELTYPTNCLSGQKEST